ncbi:MAG TPA: Crp/Fnr family transcriptional regulator [Allosphingosinicella sp.]|jgi:CRP-like cAMP-binding protein
MIDRHLMKLRARDDISAEEEAAIRGVVAEVKDVPADTRIVRAHEPLEVSILLLNGIACRHKDLKDGSRQITELHVGGDFLDLHAFTLKRLDHDVLALTPCTIAAVPHARLREITERLPHLTRVYWFATNLDAAIHREWALSLGRRTAYARVAHLFCELHVRLALVGLAQADGYDFALTQTDLAECLGLTSVHVNRTLKELRENGLLEFRGGRARILDRFGLEAAAEFDPTYLYLERRER